MIVAHENRVSSVPFIPVQDGCRWYYMKSNGSFAGLFDVRRSSESQIEVEVRLNANNLNGEKMEIECITMSFEAAIAAFGKMEFELVNAFNFDR